jgi:hypothetical protein
MGKPVKPLAVLWSLLALLVLGAQVRGQEAVEHRERQEKASAAIEDVGGKVERDERAPGKPVISVWFSEPLKDADLDSLAAFPRLERLTLSKTGITDAGLARLQILTDLKSLSIAEENTTDLGLAHIAKLQQLEDLTLSSMKISVAGLKHLEMLPHLGHLALSDMHLNDQAWEPLAKLTWLRTLDLHGTDLSPAAFAKLKDALPGTIVRHPRDKPAATDRSVDPLVVWLWWCAAVAAGAGSLLVLWRWLAKHRGGPWGCIGKLAVTIGILGLLAAALLEKIPEMRPVQEGNAAEFWYFASRIDMDSPEMFGGVFYEAFDDWLLYYHQGFHGQFLYRVSRSDVEALFPKLLDKLERANPQALLPQVREGYHDWVKTRPARTDAMGLVAKIRAANHARLGKENPELLKYVSANEVDLRDRWQRAQGYKWNIVFESCLFCGLVLIAVWPWLRGAGPVRWAIHLALLPVLFLAPYWLGYAQWTFTSVGPSGGVLYPHLLLHARSLPWTSWDTRIVQNLPQVLEPLSQTSGSPMVLSGAPAAGPCLVLAASAVLAIGIPVIVRLKKSWGKGQ